MILSWFLLHWPVVAGIAGSIVLLLLLRAFLNWRGEERFFGTCAREVVAVLADLRGDQTDTTRAPHMAHYLGQALGVVPGDVHIRRQGQFVEAVIRGPVDTRLAARFEQRILEHPNRPPWLRFEIRLAEAERAPWAR